MRRLVVPSALLLVLVACSSNVVPPRETLAREQVVAGRGLDVAAARQAVVDFLDAYAHSADDGGTALQRTVAGDKLSDWVHWLTVQNQSFPGTISGSVELRSLNYLLAIPTQGTLAARIDLGATVRFQYAPDQGQPFSADRIMDGVATLVLRNPADWGVLDITRDGRSMADAIQVFKNVSRSSAGITVKIDSLFTFQPYWSFNLVVRNGSKQTISFDPKDASLAPEHPEGEQPKKGQAVTPPLAEIRAGDTVEGSINFTTPASPDNQVLHLPLRMGKRIVVFEFPLGAIVNPAPSPSPTVSPPVG